MANLPETPVWEEGIYQLETTDPVQGGPDGVDNLPNKQLANRTAYLKGRLDKLETAADAGYFDPRDKGAKFDLVADDLVAINETIAAAAAAGGGIVRLTGGPGALVSGTIIPMSNVTILADTGFVIRLANQANTELLGDISATAKTNIAIVGGVWDANGKNQTRDDDNGYIGVAVRFKNVDGLVFRDLTIKDPVSFGFQMGDVTNFVIRNITFDYDRLRPNMDGIHINGNCSVGQVHNLRGNTGDDMLALNANDGAKYELSAGPIHDVQVSGLYSDDGYRAVRILSGTSPVYDVTIKDVHGAYKYAAILFSNYGTGDSEIYGIQLSEINAETTAFLEAIIHIDTNVKSLQINGITRRQDGDTRTECVRVTTGYTVDQLTIDGITLRDETDNGITVVHCSGHINDLAINNVSVQYRGVSATPKGQLLLASGSDCVIRNAVINGAMLDGLSYAVRVRDGGAINALTLNSVVARNFLNAVLNDASTITRIALIGGMYLGGGRAIRLQGTLGTFCRITSQGAQFDSLDGIPVYLESGQSVSLVTNDFGFDPTVLTPQINDTCINNQSSKGTLGPCWHNGSEWRSLIDGTIIA